MSAPRIYIGDLNSDSPLPMDLIAKLDVSVDEDLGKQFCGRCQRRWSRHAWLLFVATAVLDCSADPREQARQRRAGDELPE